MREIKFRGWHTVAERMFSSEEMAADQLTLLPTGQFVNVSGDSTRLSQTYPQDKFIPMQYTGLKDKQGKEIYEGDIVASLNETLSIIWVDCTARFALKSPRYEAEMTIDNGECEVIGNIYENPELLKEVTNE